MTGFCEHGNEPLYSMKGGEFLDQLLKDNCTVLDILNTFVVV